LWAIDLHWLPHAHGAVEIASLVNKHHTDVPLVFGGFSASFCPEELDVKPQIDQGNRPTLCEKDELDIPTSGIPVRPLEVARMVIEDGVAAIRRRLPRPSRDTNGWEKAIGETSAADKEEMHE
jgi:hypothetical protein